MVCDATARHTSETGDPTTKKLRDSNPATHALGYRKVFCQVYINSSNTAHNRSRLHPSHALTRAAIPQVQPEELAADADHVRLMQHLKRRRKHKGNCSHSFSARAVHSLARAQGDASDRITR